jgi:hypothetical protein
MWSACAPPAGTTKPSYFAITTCALFNFYNRWITASGVAEMSEEAHRQQGRHLARHGYVRDGNG